jgi:hypothetical protein
MRLDLHPDQDFARDLYRDAYGYLRLYEHRWTKRAALEFRAYPQPIRRAAARSYNARRYAPVYWTHDNARAKYDDGWLPF